MTDRTGIAFLVPYRFIPPVNGGHRAAFGFADFLGRERPLTCLSSHNNEKEALPFRLLTLFPDRFWKYFSPLVGRRLFYFLRKEKVETLILHQPFMGFFALPLRWLLGLQLIVFVQNLEYQRFRSLRKWWWPGMWLFEWMVYRSCDHLLFISPDDRPPAIRTFGLNPDRCRVTPYGTYYEAPPANRASVRQAVCRRHDIPENAFLLIFFGPQTYPPNLEAVQRIIDRINPRLLTEAGFSYRILICGGGLPERYDKLKSYRDQHVRYLGFVEDIDEYVLAADLMLNPITTGGGVKTKVIEALALGTPVISMASGAKGVDTTVCGEALQIVPDDDHRAFAERILSCYRSGRPPVPPDFFKTYHWRAAIHSALEIT